MRPDLMQPAQRAVHGGLPVNLAFPVDTTRGVAFVLERQTLTGWELSHHLISNMGGGDPTWHLPGEEIAWEDIGIGGLGPDQVLLPPDLAAGAYRICTANAGDNFCTPIQILAP